MRLQLIIAPCFVAACCFIASFVFAQQEMETGGQKMPDEWIDKDTKHKVIRLTRNGGSNLSFYFHNNPFIGNKMVYYGNRQLHLLDLSNFKSEQLTFHSSPLGGEIVHAKSGTVYYQIKDSVYSVNVNTKKSQLVFVFPADFKASITTVNADGSLLGGAKSDDKEKEILRNNPNKSQFFNLIYEAKLPRTLFTIYVKSKKLNKIFTDSAWLNHVQFSTTDPNLLMFCHEGPWHKVDRIWTIDVRSKKVKLMHKRTMLMEIAGHEWFAPDGKRIWFDLQQPRSQTFFVAGTDVTTGQQIKYALQRDEWSIHFNVFRDGKLFCGDGGDAGQVARAKDAMWIYLFRPNGERFVSERLVNMKHHNYRLEPNVHFSPDGKWVIFRANFEGVENVYAVEVAAAGAALKWPAATSTTKPWTRWWWEGSAVNKKDLSWNLEQYQYAGLGGVEITPIYGVYGAEKEFINFLSPQWLDVFKHTLDESKRLGLGVDLANATGWPFGGPWVKEQDASQSIYHKTYSLKTGEMLKEPVRYEQEAFVRTANNKPARIDTIKKPVWTNTNLQQLALDQIVYPGTLPLQALMAYNANGQSINLTSKVDANGKLNWTAPSGEWTLYAVFSGLHGKMVERAAPGGEGYAIDHFSAKAANNYFKKFDEAFKGFDLSGLRAFFNDSYEVDDARGQANWTPLLFDEFKKRRGYDLRDQLPALFGKASADQSARVIYDYRTTIDELILHHFTEIWKKWGASKGALVRNQSHGSPANTLDLYDAVDIPETEGTDILRFKFAASAGNVSGKQLVAAESATWLNEHFLSSWGDVKKAIDLYFLGGVNHIVYHGTAYSPQNAAWPGWLFYAAVHFQPTNPQWKHFHALNSYITRAQSFLQGGKPDNDVLLYYPLPDRYSEPGNVLLQHFDGMERNFEHTDFEHVSKWMLENGYGFDFFSDRQLQKFKFANGQIHNGYKTILLPGNKYIPEASLAKLVELAKAGARIIVYKSLPTDVPGWGGLDKRRQRFKELIKAGAFTVNDDLNVLMDAAGVKKESIGLPFVRRKNADGKVYFINNRNDQPFSGWINLNTSAPSVGLFNPMTGETGLAAQNGTQVFVQLPAHASLIIQTYNSAKKAAAYPYYESAGKAENIGQSWELEFLSGGPTLPPKSTLTNLTTWADPNFSGIAKYTTHFAKPAGNATCWLLDLGKVHETAEVTLNGKKLATLTGPSFQINIPAHLLQNDNTLEIEVASLMANRIIYMDKNNQPWKIFYNTNMPARKRENVKNGLFDASGWQSLPSGLLGPVSLTPQILIIPGK